VVGGERSVGVRELSRIALVTCRQLPEPDHDEELLLEALHGAGHEAALLAWDYEGADPAEFDLCVPRSCWNYFREPPAFLAFVDRVERTSRMMNPPATVRWNFHKRYLAELEAAGVPIVPTAFLERGASVDLADLLADRGWSDVVVKPSVSAASFRTRRFSAGDLPDARAFLDLLLTERDALVQRYMESVEEEGERALVWIDGELTHAIRKTARFADQHEEVSEALPISKTDRAIAERALGCVAEELLYARVDVVRDAAGGWLLSELELIEPSLFLQQSPKALARLVAAIGRQAVDRAARGGG
jgi:hypothetical protein